MIICTITAGWYESVLQNSSDEGWLDREDTKKKITTEFMERDMNANIYINYIGIPAFTLIFAVYVYWDELSKKIGFLLLDKRVKDYKNLRAGV
jgi:hypothetical protein